MSDSAPRWFEKRTDFVQIASPGMSAAPVSDATCDLWIKCPGCSETLFREALVELTRVCPNCDHHFRMSAVDRLRSLCKEGTITLHDADLASEDPLGFVDSKAYDKRISAARRKTGRNDAFVAVTAEVDGVVCEIGSFDFGFMGGSMGSVVGEKITRLFERALASKRPAIVFSSSGGARMQEGVLSLMQMAKTCAALAALRDASIPYISVLTDPTTGGVAASFSMLGDINIAEPKALIGFAGPRVIRETIGQELPDGFQTSEYLMDHGQVDMIVHRHQLKATLGQLMRQMTGAPAKDGAQKGA